MIHVTLPQLCAYLDGELPDASAELVRRHLCECLECTERFASLEEQEEVLARILGDEPNEEFFQRLTASIPLGQPTKPERPVTAERARPAPPRRNRRAEDAVRSGRGARAAWIAAVVCLVVVGSVAWVVFRPRFGANDAATMAEPPAPAPEEAVSSEPEQTSMPPLEETTEPEPGPASDPVLDVSPEAVPEEAPAAEPAPKAAVPERAAAREAVVPRDAKPKPKSAPAPAPAPPPERLVERAPRHLVPVRTVITETVVGLGTDKAPPEAAPAAPRPVAAPDRAAAAFRAATNASLEAAKSKLPASFDRSAEAWEVALPLLANSPETLAVARRELAQSRFQAWAAEPTPARRDAAIASARQYLLYAPPGPERDQAWTWLGRLKH